MTDEPCEHSLTLARYTEICAECGEVIEQRPPQETELRVAMRSALNHLLDRVDGDPERPGFQPYEAIRILLEYTDV